MRKKLSVLLIVFSCILVLIGCTDNYLYSKEPITIGQIGNTTLPNYKNVTVTSLTTDDLVENTSIRSNYDVLLIDDLFFDTVSQQSYIEAFYEKELTIIFLGSNRGWMPFLKPPTLDLPKTYKDFNPTPTKQAILIQYKQQEPSVIKAVPIEETLSKEHLASLIQTLHD